ncbi:response regulator transcription factor [Pelagibacterium sp. H642]|uniref:winged helix-turn-helix transcriptional regulator n=1 Tax=Pelagibacterium sp. H642 TaxID=1881069 RepID=UPI0028167C47|nr:response regulator transcription factor [Pelagibacterium sp. H642]WMT92559.1 response regulator transcription factor [Pelagibacterium sp. H642]
MASILIASTDADFYLLLSHILVEAGFTVTLASSVEEVAFLSVEANPLAILLDCRSGETMAMDACLRLKQDAATVSLPAVALIGPGAEHQHLNLMKAGIDDTFVRPMAPRKLIDFLNGLAGPVAGKQDPRIGEGLLAHGDITIDLKAHKVARGGHEIHLGPIEFRLLRHLIEHAGQICSRDALVAAGWQKGRFVDRRTVNVHIGRLRRALGQSGGDVIRTVRSAGYLLEGAGERGARGQDRPAG